MDKNTKGILLMSISAISFSLGGLLVKLIPWQPLAISAGRCVFSSIVIALFLYFTKYDLHINKTTIKGAVFVALMMVTYIVSNKLTTAANAIILEYSAPIFIVFFDYLIFKKKPSKYDILVTVLVLIGIIIVFADGIKFGSTLGNIIAIISGVFYALSMMLNSFEDGDSLTSVILAHMSIAIIGLPFIFKETDFSVKTLSLVSCLGIFQAGLGYACMALGTKFCNPLTAIIVASIEPILNPILVAIFYKETITVNSILGAAIVVLTIVINNIIQEKKKTR